MKEDCPYNLKGKHYFTFTCGSGIKADFEPVEYGKTAADTLYRRTEYSLMSCACGATTKQKLRTTHVEAV